MEKIEQDYLNFNNDKEIRKFIREETVLFSDKVNKINRYGFSQERNILITLNAVYNIKKKELKRRIDVSVIRGITSSKLNNEFVMHCNDVDYDYHYVSTNKIKIIANLAKAFNSATQKDLKVFELEAKSLKNVVTTKKEKKKDVCFSKMPENGLVPISNYLIFLSNDTPNDTDRKPTKGRTNTIFSRKKEVQEVKLSDFNILKVLGRGSFGKVYMVEYIATKEIFAMKTLKKDVLIDQEQVENTLLEKKILQTMEHPFLVSLIFCFQTEDRIYFIMPFMRGGELFQHLKNFRIFEEDKVRFYASQIAIAIDYLHSLGIIYRDIKPENILMDDEGYLKLADFGMAKHLKAGEKTMSFCGTPEYLAPEIIIGDGHDKSADWWSFGILVYEMVYGIPPFYHENIERMYELIKLSELRFPKKSQSSTAVQDLLIKLLDKNPATRLGSKKGFADFKNHPFFVKMDFDMIYKRQIKAPFIPEISSKTDASNFDPEFTQESIKASIIQKKDLDLIRQNEDKFKDF